MKRRISDMLDGLPAPELEMEHSVPLSSERIKELTMNKINHKEKKGKRMGFRILVVAAVIATLTMTAVAAEEIFGAGDWFREILNIQLEKDAERAEEIGITVRETIGQDQIEVVNALGKVFEEQTQTDQGSTVTMHAAYGDAYILHLYFSVEAPEGTVLPDGIYYEFVDWNAVDFSKPDYYRAMTAGGDAPYDSISQTVYIDTMPDEDPTDNKKDFHVTILGQPGTNCRFNDGYAKYFNMNGIYQQVPNVHEDDDGYVLLAPGNFSFNVGLTNEVQVISLSEAEGFVYGGSKTRTWTHDSPCTALCDEELTGETDTGTGFPIHSESWIYEVTVDYVTISPLSVEWQVAYTCDDLQMGFGLDFRVVMKDGTSPIKGYGGGMSDMPPEKVGDVGVSNGISYFTTPIDLDEVDYILIGDEELGETIKVYLPE